MSYGSLNAPEEEFKYPVGVRMAVSDAGRMKKVKGEKTPTDNDGNM